MLCSFAWTIPNLLAGSGRPGLLNPLGDDMRFISELGIRLVVTLTEVLPPLSLELYGMRGIHFPVPDMGITVPRALEPICGDIVSSIARGEPVLVHCLAGLGRTGLLLACSLVAMGESPDRALTRVRQINRNYVQTQAQEQLIGHYSQFIEERAAPLGAAVMNLTE